MWDIKLLNIFLFLITINEITYSTSVCFGKILGLEYFAFL